MYLVRYLMKYSFWLTILQHEFNHMTSHEYYMSDVQVCHQRHSSASDLLLIFLCSLIQALTLTPPPNNALLANMDMRVLHNNNILQYPPHLAKYSSYNCSMSLSGARIVRDDRRHIGSSCGVLMVSNSEGSEVFNGCGLDKSGGGAIPDSGSSDGSSSVNTGTGSNDTGTHLEPWRIRWSTCTFRWWPPSSSTL